MVSGNTAEQLEVGLGLERGPTWLDPFFQGLEIHGAPIDSHTIRSIPCPPLFVEGELFAMFLKRQAAAHFLRDEGTRVKVITRFSEAMAERRRKCALVVYADMPPPFEEGPNTPIGFIKHSVPKWYADELRGALKQGAQYKIGVSIPLENECEIRDLGPTVPKVRVAIVLKPEFVADALEDCESKACLRDRFYEILGNIEKERLVPMGVLSQDEVPMTSEAVSPDSDLSGRFRERRALLFWQRLKRLYKSLTEAHAMLPLMFFMLAFLTILFGKSIGIGGELSAILSLLLLIGTCGSVVWADVQNRQAATKT